MEDSVLVAVFPSTFSQNKIKPIMTNIKKILKIQNQKFHKIRQDGDIIVVETNDPVFTSSTINSLFGIKGVAIAKQVPNNFKSIVNVKQFVMFFCRARPHSFFCGLFN